MARVLFSACASYCRRLPARADRILDEHLIAVMELSEHRLREPGHAANPLLIEGCASHAPVADAKPVRNPDGFYWRFGVRSCVPINLFAQCGFA